MADVRPQNEQHLPRILCVDDEPNVVEGIRRSLRGSYDVVTAVGPRAAIAILEQDVDFAVVLSDLRMPELDGVILLNQVRDGAPDIVRILLTGYADTDAAIRAVNDGQIFRFLTKPCTPALLRSTLDSAVEHHRVVKAERVLLEQTLQGSVQLLTDVLSLAQPAAFGRAGRLKRKISELAAYMKIRDRWAIELAALFSQLGAVTLPAALIDKVYHGQPLNEAEQELAARISLVSEQLLSHIPRFEPVRDILRFQHTHFNGHGSPMPSVREEFIPIGARLLAIVRDFDVLEAQGLTMSLALDTMYGRTGWYDMRALNAFAATQGANEGLDVREMPLANVSVGMVFVNDVTEGELLLVARGQEVTHGVVDRIHHHWANFSAAVTVRVIVPAHLH
jgi:response regulator RpfG family c-di-GMP phosphodiesterase